jgi:hypothetical protein
MGLWGRRCKPIPRAKAPSLRCVAEDLEGCFPTVDDGIVDPIYPVDAYF